MDNDMTQVYVIDRDGRAVCDFALMHGVSLAEQANMNGADIPLACCAGACMVCACRVVEGAHLIDKEMLGYQLTVLDSDDGICSCISGSYGKDHAPEGQNNERIVLQKQF